jgi:hypothetical protein
MGRELKRVPLNFDWPIDKTWKGYLNPHPGADQCSICEGTGMSRTARHWDALWYGRIPFRPKDNGSTPFQSDDAFIRAMAENHSKGNPKFYGTSPEAIGRESARLANLFNTRWACHLNEDEVTALLAEGRLRELTHTWKDGKWSKDSNAPRPTARQVGEYFASAISDSGSLWTLIKKRYADEGVSPDCSPCKGEGGTWPSDAVREAYEGWEREDPPKGDAYQIWQTVGEGSPISPPFATPEGLAQYMAGRAWGADYGTPYDVWLKFIRGPGWAPSAIGMAGNMMTGVAGVVALEEEANKKTPRAQKK